MKIPEKLEFGNPEHIKIVKTLAKRNEDRKKDNEDTICGGVSIEDHHCDCEHCESDAAVISVHFDCFNCNKTNQFDDDDWGMDNAKDSWDSKEISCQTCGAKHISVLDEQQFRTYDSLDIFPLSYDEVEINNPNQLKMEI